MKGYKAFGKGLVCRGKQYAENTVFEEDKAVICKIGMHFCENPFDVLDYYPLINDKCELSEFAEVEALDDAYTDDNKKFCTKKLKIGAKLSLKGFIEACVGFAMENTKSETKNDVASSHVVASGYSSKLAASGNYSQLAASGDSSKLAASGYSSKLAASGNYSQLAASGDSSKLAASGKHSVVAGIGIDNIAKAVKGCWITLAEWRFDSEGNEYIPIYVKTEYVDGERIKENTYYKLENGEFVECENEEII